LNLNTSKAKSLEESIPDTDNRKRIGGRSHTHKFVAT
jgi:hypothetical protein